MDLSRPLMDRHEVWTQFCGGGQPLKPTFEKKFTSPLKSLAGKKSHFVDRRQSEARNFESSQHYRQTKNMCFIYSNCATKWYQTWGHHPTEFLWYLGGN